MNQSRSSRVSDRNRYSRYLDPEDVEVQADEDFDMDDTINQRKGSFANGDDVDDMDDCAYSLESSVNVINRSRLEPTENRSQN